MNAPSGSWRTPLLVITAGCLISLIGFGVRSGFGLFLEPMTVSMDWNREIYGLAMALQNLFWGLSLPFAGALADRFGPVWVIISGAVMYALAVYGMSIADTPMLLHLTGGILAGVGIAFSAFTIAMASMARVVEPEKRSMVLGLGTAAGSLGQFLFSPITQGFIGAFGWITALVLLASILMVMVPLSFVLPNDPNQSVGETVDQTMGEALREAGGHLGYILLTAGFFVCGFHLAFITVHFPAYIQDLGMDPVIGAWAIGVIGLMNIVGSVLSGIAGQRFSKKMALSLIYFLRSVAILALLVLPKTPLVILTFAGAIGLLWLSTVPLTTGIVAQVFGVRYMSMLFGIVFLSHQLGSFLGVWLGGRIYDQTGSYDGIWYAGIILGLAAALVHLPINERPLPRLRMA
ncbi:MAG: MFS transporter [Gammaproteobacteria bacterium]|nr:MFS transporter [Gammaproteobacteria bacterium]MDE0715518.1 MFS transporter [Gammaproteobacteria bacterium]MXY64810.1 MFS transporter [Gammaproteobacteria bacterium]MYG65359.1 MFS transporter [Gammaproteobacteria bacterium]